MSFPWTGSKEGFLYYNPSPLSASTWLKGFLPLPVLFHFPQGYSLSGCSSSIRCHLGFQVLLLLFATGMWWHVFLANAVLPPLPDTSSSSLYVCVYTFLFCHMHMFWRMISVVSATWFEESSGFFTRSICGKVVAVFPSFNKALPIFSNTGVGLKLSLRFSSLSLDRWQN